MIRQKTVILTNPDDPSDKRIVKSLVHTNYTNSKPPGRSTKLPHNGEPQQLTDRRFMSRTQRQAFDKGEEIWV